MCYANLRRIGLYLCLLFFVVSCSSNDDVITSNTETNTETDSISSDSTSTEDYTAPTYADDYSSIASWDDRDSWNLANVHDPTVVYDDGKYYLYSTDASYGNAHEESSGHFMYRSSSDLVYWDFEGMSMSGVPSWVLDSVNNMRSRYNLTEITDPNYEYWAPCVRQYGSKYRMYYTIVVDNYIGSGESTSTGTFDNTWTERAFIGLRESSSLAMNLWTDKGMVVCSVSDKTYDSSVDGTGTGTNTPWYRSSSTDYDAYFKYNAIDPSYIITPDDEHWLIYGSWHSGIVAIQLDPDTGLPLNSFDIKDETTWGKCIASRDYSSRWQGSEAPEVIYNEETGYYYLFLAYDAVAIPYNTRVCRSTNVDGPYYDYRGTNITDDGGECYPIITHPYQFNDHSGWVGISHCAIFQENGTDNWFYSSQSRLPENTNGNEYSNAIMMGNIRKVRWTDDGWPVVMPERYADVPDLTITSDSLVGTWENISLNYEYGVQQTSTTLILSSDGTASGAFSGDWSYDEDNKLLTIGSNSLCVERELDWESDPRKPTIVYAGLDDNGISLWGKKVDD